MADVFVSYRKSDADRVRPLVENLRGAGLDVWWDEGIQPSTSWRAEIAKQLSGAKCVVAVWTEDSVDPEQGSWVMEEATHGLTRKVLAPVRLDLVSPPLGFGDVQYADLAAWSGGSEDPRFQHFLGVVQAIVRAEPIPMVPRPTHFEAPGVKLQNVQMENVTIQIGGRDDEEEEQEAERRAGPEPRESKPSFSPSLFMAQAVGVILPLAAIAIFVFSMGNMACSQGNAPAAFCRVLGDLSDR